MVVAAIGISAPVTRFPKQRDALLEEMTDSVAELVLRDSYRQTQALSLANAQAKFDQLQQGPTDSDRVAAETAVVTAEANLQSAQIKLDTLGQVTPQDMQAARLAQASAAATLQTAQAKLDQLQRKAQVVVQVGRVENDEQRVGLPRRGIVGDHVGQGLSGGFARQPW